MEKWAGNGPGLICSYLCKNIVLNLMIHTAPAGGTNGTTGVAHGRATIKENYCQNWKEMALKQKLWKLEQQRIRNQNGMQWLLEWQKQGLSKKLKVCKEAGVYIPCLNQPGNGV